MGYIRRQGAKVGNSYFRVSRQDDLECILYSMHIYHQDVANRMTTISAASWTAFHSDLLHPAYSLNVKSYYQLEMNVSFKADPARIRMQSAQCVVMHVRGWLMHRGSGGLLDGLHESYISIDLELFFTLWMEELRCYSTV